MVQYSLNFNEELVNKIDVEVNKIGCGCSRSGWVAQACVEKLDNSKMSYEQILKKLKKWHNSFPKQQFKTIIGEIENAEI